MPRECRQCAPEYQERIDEVFGTNPYGEPIFKLVWGESETMRGGGTWIDGFVGYRDVLIARNAPCWIIMMWEPGMVYGSPELWYIQNRDEHTGLQALGEYPYHGRYRALHQLVHRERVGDRIHTDYLELSSLIVESIIPLCKIWQDLSKETQVELLKRDAEIRDDEAAKAAMEAKSDYAPAFGGKPVSFSKQGCRTSLIQKKMDILERQFKMLAASAAQYQRGMQQVNY